MTAAQAHNVRPGTRGHVLDIVDKISLTVVLILGGLANWALAPAWVRWQGRISFLRPDPDEEPEEHVTYDNWVTDWVRFTRWGIIVVTMGFALWLWLVA